MPAATICRLVHQLGVGKQDWTVRAICALKVHFGVSAECFLIRLQELDLIDKPLKEKLQAEFRAYYKSHPGAEEPAPNQPRLNLTLSEFPPAEEK